MKKIIGIVLLIACVAYYIYDKIKENGIKKGLTLSALFFAVLTAISLFADWLFND